MIKDILTEPNFGIPGFNYGSAGRNPQLGTVITDLFEIIFFLATFLSFFWFVWGAFQYILAGGDKEKLGRARSRITWAIVGLCIVLLSFFITQFVGQILQPKPGQIPLPGFSLIPTAYAQVNIGDEFGLATPKTTNLGEAVGLLVIPTFSIATAAVIIYFLIGAFKWVSSGGDKEAVSSAQRMITHAVIGFIILMFTFLILQFLLSSLFGITGFKIIQGP